MKCHSYMGVHSYIYIIVAGQGTPRTKSAKLLCGHEDKKQLWLCRVGGDGSDSVALHNVQPRTSSEDVGSCEDAGRRRWCCGEMGGHERCRGAGPRLPGLSVPCSGLWCRSEQHNCVASHWTVRTKVISGRRLLCLYVVINFRAPILGFKEREGCVRLSAYIDCINLCWCFPIDCKRAHLCSWSLWEIIA